MTHTAVLSWEPSVRLTDVGLRGASWADLDREASSLLGTPVTAVPSVRVGMCWALEFLGFRRHTDHVLVPPFLGRCILNSINRRAFPVEEITYRTRLAVVVHQFGFQQDLAAIEAQCRVRGLRYLEDSPSGLAHEETVGRGSLAKFIGISKILPALKGAFMLSEDDQLTQFVRAKRSESTFWSWPLLLFLMFLRCRRYGASYSVLAEVTYELYSASPGDNALLRGNVLRALRQLTDYEQIIRERVLLVGDRLHTRVLLPDATRLAYVVPLIQNADDEKAIRTVLTRHQCDASLYHVDMNRNLFDPDYQRVFLLPLNPRIPQSVFEALVQELSRVVVLGAAGSTGEVRSESYVAQR